MACFCQDDGDDGDEAWEGTCSWSADDETSALADGKTKASAPKSFAKPPKPGTKAYCPVMKEVFTVSESSPRSEHKGRHYVFCCPGCKPKFDANPEKYI